MYVKRDVQGAIVAAYANLQEGLELEAIAPDSTELAAFMRPTEPVRRMTSLEFLDLFTEAEQLAVVQASMDHAAINLWWTKLTMATYVDFGDPRLSAGLDALVAAGLLSPQRRAEVLS